MKIRDLEGWPKAEVILHRVALFALFVLLFGLMFLNTASRVLNPGEDVLSELGIAGLVVAVPLTGGVLFQLWRLSLYRRGYLSGQWLDKIFANTLGLVSFFADAYFLLGPVFNWQVPMTLPRFVIVVYVGAHIAQEYVDFWTNERAEQKREAPEARIARLQHELDEERAKKVHSNGRVPESEARPKVPDHN